MSELYGEFWRMVDVRDVIYRDEHELTNAVIIENSLWWQEGLERPSV